MSNLTHRQARDRLAELKRIANTTFKSRDRDAYFKLKKEVEAVREPDRRR